MTHKEAMKRMEKLYEIAVENKDVEAGLSVMQMMIRAEATEAGKRG